MTFELHIRNANSSDSRFVLNLRNSRSGLRWSESGEKVSLESHKIWYSQILSSVTTNLFIGEKISESGWRSIRVGFVRFDEYQPGSWLVSIAVVESHRGKGVGRQILQLGLSAMGGILGSPADVVARVHKDNSPSLRLFHSLGFRTIHQAGDFLSLKSKVSPDEAG